MRRSLIVKKLASTEIVMALSQSDGDDNDHHGEIMFLIAIEITSTSDNDLAVW